MTTLAPEVQSVPKYRLHYYLPGTILVQDKIEQKLLAEDIEHKKHKIHTVATKG